MAMKLDIKPDHIAGGFEWEQAPSCQCGLLAQAIEGKIIFVSNMTEGGYNRCYVFLLNHDGDIHRDDGTAIDHCPWCGDEIKVRKKYPTKA